ncbi:TetR family transcriptional regulator [Mycobacterium sp. NPDC050041]|uniref:TetR family transcriptional regulator n=1 Tax=Mycobacterium sp. NPDC050041 TaxID=3364293 RepID=UPI003C303855
MSDQADRKADATRLLIVQAAARQFSRRAYGMVSLDDILADAAVTKGAMYFHFRSKYALAVAIVDHRAEQSRAVVEEVLARRLPATETLIDVMFVIAVEDLGDHLARAGLNLLESIGRTDGLATRVHGSWITGFSGIAQRAIDEGDLLDGRDADGVARLLVAMYLGIRQTSDLDDPQPFLERLVDAWDVVLPGIARPDRLNYLSQFARRRGAQALKRASPLPADDL